LGAIYPEIPIETSFLDPALIFSLRMFIKDRYSFFHRAAVKNLLAKGPEAIYRASLKE
jgi:hypothetical protein